MEKCIMAKFCDKCGAQLEDGAAFCTSCGATLGQQAQQAAPAQGSVMSNVSQGISQGVQGVQNFAADIPRDFNGFKQGVQQKNKKVIGVLIAAVVLVILIIVLLVSLIGGGGYKSPLDNLTKGFNKNDAKLITKAMMPGSVLSAYEDEEDPDWDDADDAIEASKSLIEAKYGDDVEISYEIKDKNEISESKLKKKYKSLAKRYADAADGKTSDFYPTEGYELEVELTIKGDDDEDSNDTTVVVGKVDGDWIFLDDGEFGMFGGMGDSFF